MRSLWRRFMAWLNADDVLLELSSGAFGDIPHAQHCPLCASAVRQAGAKEQA